MPIKHRIGYDNHTFYSKTELVKMYINQGMSEDKAKELAEKLYPALSQMRTEERRFWNKVREYEITAGLEPEVILEGE